MNLYFSTEEINLLCIYDAGDRRKTIRSLRNMKRYSCMTKTSFVP